MCYKFRDFKKKIVFAGGSSGFGHIQAALNLMDSIKEIDSSVDVEFVNIFDFLSPPMRFVLEDVWEFCSLHLKHVYRFAHNTIIRNEFLSDTIKRRFATTANRILPVFSEKRVGVFVATHPAAAAIGSALKRRLNFVFCVVPTDFVLHNFHFYPEVDFYYLPPQYTAVGKSIASSDFHRKSLVTGIPISPAFWKEKNRIELRKQLGLSPEKFTVLISFGGKGLNGDKHIDMLQELSRMPLPLQFLVITGENYLLRKKLENLLALRNNNSKVKVFGFVENMADMLTASDIFLGKAGGLSISEALSKGLPIAVVESLPGQEDYNARLIIRNKLGLQVNNNEMLVKWISSLLSFGMLSEWKSRVKQFGRPFSARDIADHILTLIYPVGLGPT
jgi:processive 1,2-diacylglycerol beta-glucosyltransferase